MTEIAGVEWFRESLKVRENLPPDRGFDMELSTARRLLAHIDQLEAENARLIEVAEDRIDISIRPTVHEIAVQMMAALQVGRPWDPYLHEHQAKIAYQAADALVAEGRRRDGLQK